VLLAFLIAVSFVVGRQHKEGSGTGFLPHRTTHSAHPGGLKALYEALPQLGHPVARYLDPSFSQFLSKSRPISIPRHSPYMLPK